MIRKGPWPDAKVFMLAALLKRLGLDAYINMPGHSMLMVQWRVEPDGSIIPYYKDIK